nr:transposase [Corallococcus llansteffanensis]
MSFIQFFGSASQVPPHFHSRVPDGVFVPRGDGVRFEPVPPPTQAEVEWLLRGVRYRVLRLLEKRGALPRTRGERGLGRRVPQRGSSGLSTGREHPPGGLGSQPIA